MPEFAKLSNLVGEEITIKDVTGSSFKKWDNDAKRMLTSTVYEEGYRKLYQVVTDKGQLDLGTGQLGALLEAVFDKGKADLIGKTFHVKSNGKTGIDIRYYFNVVNNSGVESPW